MPEASTILARVKPEWVDHYGHMNLAYYLVVFDLDLEPKRLGLLLDVPALKRVQFIRGDVCDSEQLNTEVQRQRIDYIIHLAGLQVPTCRANPRLGAMVNVVGTINVFEAARAVECARGRGEVGRAGRAGRVDRARLVHRQPGDHIAGAAAQVGGVPQRRPVRIQLRHKGIIKRAAET